MAMRAEDEISAEMERVCAVVVTFHPDAEVRENLLALCAQVQDVVVVDNGSSERELQGLRATGEELGFSLVENGENLGIAAALNVGVRWAMERGCGWVMLFDQDSRVTEGFKEAMVQGFKGSGWGSQLGLLVPAYVDQRLRTRIAPERGKVGLNVAMTSGSLLRTETFRRHGGFVEELFIDGVDHEYSLRLRAAGLVIDEFEGAVLLHEPGAPEVHRRRGLGAFQAANYSPLRRYYQERNKIWIARRYWRQFPDFCVRMFTVSLKDFVKILWVEQDKAQKCRYFLRGVRDGLLGRLGRFAAG